MKHLLYILTICFTMVLMSGCQKTELDDLKPMKVSSDERVDGSDVNFPGKGDSTDNDDSGDEGDNTDGITDDDDEDDDDELEDRTTTNDGL